MVPRSFGSAPEAVFLNTSGGVTGGDHLGFSARVAAGTSLVATTQTAERAYASAGGMGHMDVSFDVEAGGTLLWVPQETILFNASALNRFTDISLAEDASLLLAETVILGREAMGEVVDHLGFLDRRQVRLDGAPYWLDQMALTSVSVAAHAHPVLLGGARAIATLFATGPAFTSLKTPTSSETQVSRSDWNGKTVMRMASRNTYDLRKTLAQVVAQASPNGLPRVWQI